MVQSSTRKSKRVKFSGGSEINKQIAESLRIGQEQAGELDLELIPLDRIDLDPDNPRSAGLTIADISNQMLTGVDNTEKAAIVDSLQRMAVTIKNNGVQQPIKVYRTGDRFRVIFGERRVLASHIAKQATIPAWILAERPKLMRVIQYIENFQRENLTPWGRLQNIKGILQELKQANLKANASILAEHLGVTQRQAATYLAVADAPLDVLDAIKNGNVSNLEKAAVIAGIKALEKRKTAIEACESGATLEELRAIAKQKISKTRQTKNSAGRPATKINLGTTTNSLVVRHIIEAIVGKDAYKDTDWNDFRSVNIAWKAFIEDLATKSK